MNIDDWFDDIASNQGQNNTSSSPTPAPQRTELTRNDLRGLPLLSDERRQALKILNQVQVRRLKAVATAALAIEGSRLSREAGLQMLYDVDDFLVKLREFHERRDRSPGEVAIVQEKARLHLEESLREIDLYRGQVKAEIFSIMMETLSEELDGLASLFFE